MAKLHKRRWHHTKKINMQVLLPRLNCRADGRMKKTFCESSERTLKAMAWPTSWQSQWMTTTFLWLIWKTSRLPTPKNKQVAKNRVHNILISLVEPVRTKRGVHFSWVNYMEFRRKPHIKGLGSKHGAVHWHGAWCCLPIQLLDPVLSKVLIW